MAIVALVHFDVVMVAAIVVVVVAIVVVVEVVVVRMYVCINVCLYVCKHVYIGLYAYWVWRGFCCGGCVPGDGSGNSCHAPPWMVLPYYSPILPDIKVSAKLPSVRWRRKFLPSTTQRVPRPLPSGPRVQRPTSVAESPASDQPCPLMLAAR